MVSIMANTNSYVVIEKNMSKDNMCEVFLIE